MGLDVAAAFDKLAPKRIAQQLAARGAMPAQVAAVLCETVGARVQPRFGEVLGLWTEFATGVRQGAARSPEVWNHVVCGPVEAARRRMDEACGPSAGWSAELSRWELLLWADNLFVVADSWEVVARSRAYEETLLTINFDLSPRSLEELANAHAGEPTIEPTTP